MSPFRAQHLACCGVYDAQKVTSAAGTKTTTVTYKDSGAGAGAGAGAGGKGDSKAGDAKAEAKGDSKAGIKSSGAESCERGGSGDAPMCMISVPDMPRAAEVMLRFQVGQTV
jgi:hypothetical protein